MFRFLHRLVRQLCVSHKTFLISALDLLAVISVSMILNLIIQGRLDADVNGISANFQEKIVAGVAALKVALDPSRDMLLVATDALHKGALQVTLELSGEDTKSGIWRVSRRANRPTHELWLQGGLVEN